jgi:hypothetical protein
MRLNRSASLAWVSPPSSSSSRTRSANAFRCRSRGPPLAPVGQQRGELGLGRAVVDRFQVVDIFGLEQQHRPWAVRGAEAGEEVGIAGRDDAADQQLAGHSMVGMEAVALPRVVPEHDIGASVADGGTDPLATRTGRFQLTVDEPGEAHVRDPERGGGGPLLTLAGLDQCGRVGGRVPRPLRPVGEHEELAVGARCRPLRERRTTAEFHIVRVCADGQGATRDVEVA